MIDEMYDDVRQHVRAGDRIAAVAVNRSSLTRISFESRYEILYMQKAYEPRGFQFMGYPVALIDEIPDGEWIIVCEERSIPLIDWAASEKIFADTMGMLEKYVIKGKPL